MYNLEIREVKQNTESEALLECERGDEACKGSIQGKLFKQIRRILVEKLGGELC